MPTQETLSDYERERGKPMPSKLHSITQKNLIIAFHDFEPPYTVFSELTLELGNRQLTPDISVYREMEVDFIEDVLRMTDPPLLAIEIASPTQGIQDLVDKARALLDNGVDSCWLVQPQLKTITVFTGEMESTTYSDGTVTDPVTDISVTLDDVFTSAGGEGRRE